MTKGGKTQSKNYLAVKPGGKMWLPTCCYQQSHRNVNVVHHPDEGSLQKCVGDAQ